MSNVRVTQEQLLTAWLPEATNSTWVTQEQMIVAWLPQATNATWLTQVQLIVAWLPAPEGGAGRLLRPISPWGSPFGGEVGP